MKNNRNIYTTALEAATHGARVTVSLKQHSFAVDGSLLIDHGQWQGELGVEATDALTALARIEDAFARYQTSMPNIDENDLSRWFHAYSADELSDWDLILGDDRLESRCRLEVLVLMYIVNRSLTRHCPPMDGKWFWQSAKHPHLVILADWLME